MLSLASLVHIGSGSNFVNKKFLLPSWRESLKTTDASPLRTANGGVVSVEGIVPLFDDVAAERVYSWLGVVVNIMAYRLFGTSLIGDCFCGTFLPQRKMVLCHSQSVAIT